MCNTNDFNIDEIALSEFGEVTLFGGEPIDNLTEIATEREDPWNEYPAVKPDTITWVINSGIFIVESNRGVDVAYYHDTFHNGWTFQDRNGDDEGFWGEQDNQYKVYRWMELPEGKCEKE